ncbi:hypothetical protein HPB47_010730 [Ixodes persulcatus]|uniref:Uncharacterized protein n=1 Tax=Ixodes persulcatus TaxID=34615 RepID=A0AC60NYH9_IXOPE|nr:hypothetical protein HPB47_010730 [Ixodes persulcatus]
MAALGRTSALVAAALFLCLAAAGSETPEASDRQHRGGFQKLRLSTARGFGKRIPPGLAFLRQRNQEPADPIIKKGFRKMKISTARGFGKREDPDLSFLLENEDMDPYWEWWADKSELRPRQRTRSLRCRAANALIMTRSAFPQDQK